MSTLRTEEAHGYDECQSKLQQLKGDGFHIWTLFCGSLKEPGVSWCPDCTKALPVIENGLHQLKEKLRDLQSVKAAYLFVSIERDDWKNNDSPFRRDEKLKLTSIPTVIHWEGNTEKKRLIEQECCVPEKVNHIFMHL